MITELMRKIQDAYDLSDAELDAAIADAAEKLGLTKSQVNTIIDRYEAAIDLGKDVTEAELTKWVNWHKAS